MLRYLTCIVTVVFWHLIKDVWAVTTNIKSKISLVLEHRTRTQDHKEKFKLSCIWQEPLLFTLTCIGKIMGPMKSTYGIFSSSMLYSCIIDLPNYCSGRTSLNLITRNKALIMILEYHKSGDVLFLCLNLNY